MGLCATGYKGMRFIKLQATRNKHHARQPGRDSPLIEMAPVVCLQSKALGIHPSPPLRLSAHVQHIFTTWQSLGREAVGNFQEFKVLLHVAEPKQSTLSWQGNLDNRNSPAQETSALRCFVGRRSPQSHLSPRQLLALFENAFTSGALLFCFLPFLLDQARVDEHF